MVHLGRRTVLCTRDAGQLPGLAGNAPCSETDYARARPSGTLGAPQIRGPRPLRLCPLCPQLGQRCPPRRARVGMG
ncbi:hypothetical protein U0070_004150 [Myodes glareolus]|uniref:Uncharacterized protein n=1 Tax=Myodes glareolus TaxID=447135 RepID=A0AAW0H2V4_MYOGA